MSSLQTTNETKEICGAQHFDLEALKELCLKTSCSQVVAPVDNGRVLSRGSKQRREGGARDLLPQLPGTQQGAKIYSLWCAII